MNSMRYFETSVPLISVGMSIEPSLATADAASQRPAAIPMTAVDLNPVRLILSIDVSVVVIIFDRYDSATPAWIS